MNIMKKIFIIITSLVVICTSAHAENEKKIDSIVELKNATLSGELKRESRTIKSLVISDLDTAKKILTGATLEAVQDLDFETKKILMFQWRGSCKDKLNYFIDESKPKHVTFERIWGRAKHSCHHVKVYIINKDFTFTPPK